MRVYEIKVNGKKYKVEVMGISEVSPTVVETKTVAVASNANEAKATPTPASAPSGNVTPILAPMQGTILDVKVLLGQSVNAGDTIAILEAMKLENEIKSSVSGKVVEVKVNKGQNVNNKDVIVVIG